MSRKKGDPGKVHPTIALAALEMAGGDRRGAYTQCVVRSFRITGRMGPGFDNADLQAWYDQNLPKEDQQ